MISPPNSDKIVTWQFLRNRRLILHLHTIFRALIYRAHRAVVPAIAWHLVVIIITYCSRDVYLHIFMQKDHVITHGYVTFIYGHPHAVV